MLENAKMFKLFKSKTAFSDVTIIATILFIFIGTAVALPFINSEFEITSPDYDIGNVESELVAEEFSDVSDIKAGDLLKSLGKIFFWTFGDLPLWLDLIFTILRIIFFYIIIRTFTPFISGGG